MAIKKIVTFTASDGTSFDDEKQAREYEKQLKIAETQCPLIIKKIQEDIDDLRKQILELRSSRFDYGVRINTQKENPFTPKSPNQPLPPVAYFSTSTDTIPYTAINEK